MSLPARERCSEVRPDSRTVFVTHRPAHGIRDFAFWAHEPGSRSLQAFLGTRLFLARIHGHSHSGFGRDGAHFNVASASRTRVMLIDLETLEHQVVTDSR